MKLQLSLQCSSEGLQMLLVVQMKVPFLYLGAAVVHCADDNAADVHQVVVVDAVVVH